MMNKSAANFSEMWANSSGFRCTFSLHRLKPNKMACRWQGSIEMDLVRANSTVLRIPSPDCLGTLSFSN